MRSPHSWLLMGFTALPGLAVEQEEGEFYLAQDLFLPLADVSKKAIMPAPGSTRALDCRVKQVGFPAHGQGS